MDPEKMEELAVKGTTPTVNKASQETLTRWNEQVIVHRDALIAQAKAGYDPLIALIPAEYRQNMEEMIKNKLRELYEEEEQEVVKWFNIPPAPSPSPRGGGGSLR